MPDLDLRALEWVKDRGQFDLMAVQPLGLPSEGLSSRMYVWLPGEYSHLFVTQDLPPVIFYLFIYFINQHPPPITGPLDEDVVVIEATSTQLVQPSEEINVTSTDSEVEIVTVGDGYR